MWGTVGGTGMWGVGTLQVGLEDTGCGDTIGWDLGVVALGCGVWGHLWGHG